MDNCSTSYQDEYLKAWHEISKCKGHGKRQFLEVWMQSQVVDDNIRRTDRRFTEATIEIANMNS